MRFLMIVPKNLLKLYKKYNRYNKDQLALKEVDGQSGGWMGGFCSIL